MENQEKKKYTFRDWKIRNARSIAYKINKLVEKDIQNQKSNNYDEQKAKYDRNDFFAFKDMLWTFYYVNPYIAEDPLVKACLDEHVIKRAIESGDSSEQSQ